MTDEPRYWKVGEIAELLRVRQETVLRWLAKGDLKGLRLGSRTGWRVADGDLKQFIDRSREPRS